MSGKTSFRSAEGVYTVVNRREINGIKATSTTAKQVPLSKRQSFPGILKGYSFSQGDFNKVLQNSPAIKLVPLFSVHAHQMGIYGVLDNSALTQFLA